MSLSAHRQERFPESNHELSMEGDLGSMSRRASYFVARWAGLVFDQTSKRASRSRSVVIPKYPPSPPPVSSLRRHSSVSSNTSSFKSIPSSLCNKTISQNVNRPPPRSGVPADSDFEVDIDDDDEVATLNLRSKLTAKNRK
ncbi:hypothetical protein D9613_008841 [Agrocybe pediades]|uniref:Uncharacterized protein n=1 Tax=Agrocybe pediades TaxID=84607 RepID=A0A8H4QTC8_9AGAR|nr:hypothetical protein D9613_008841 [Agrocybe pediades]